MKTVYFTLLLTIMYMGTGCKRNVNENTPLPILNIGLSVDKQVPNTFTWNSIAKRTTYIPISTPSNALIGSAALVHIGNDCYYMIDQQTKTIFRTEKDGKIIHSFSRVGNGPGEYAMLSYVHVNPEDSTIRVFDQKNDKCIVYDLAGNFIKEIFLKEKKASVPVFMSNNYVVVRGIPEEKHKLYITDKELNIRKRLFPMDTTCTDMECLCLIWQINRCQNRDRTLINFANEDTVFNITENGSHPFCILKKGEYGLPESEAKKPMSPTPQGSPYIRTMRLTSIPGYYLISYMLKNHLYDEVWSKTDNQIISRFTNKNGEAGYPFCLPSGKKIQINANSLFIQGNIVAFFISADIAAEEKIVNVKEDDNPVLVIMEL